MFETHRSQLKPSNTIPLGFLNGFFAEVIPIGKHIEVISELWNHPRPLNLKMHDDNYLKPQPVSRI